jgi:hypothetical protein
MDGSRKQILADLAGTVMAAAVRSVERLESDGVDRGEAIRQVQAALARTGVSEAELVAWLTQDQRGSVTEEAPDDRELGGEA